MIVRKIHIITAMMQKTGWSYHGSRRVLTMVLDEITEALSRGDSVHLVQFGMFRVVTENRTGNRFGYDPVTGKHPILGRMSYRRAVVRFFPTRTGRLEENLKKLLPPKKENFHCRRKMSTTVDSL